MDYKLVWSSEALDDIESIGEYIERDSKFYAESVVQKIFDAPQFLPQFPNQGRIVPELGNQNIREIFVYQYRIIYEIFEREIQILTVIHGKRDLEKYYG